MHATDNECPNILICLTRIVRFIMKRVSLQHYALTVVCYTIDKRFYIVCVGLLASRPLNINYAGVFFPSKKNTPCN